MEEENFNWAEQYLGIESNKDIKNSNAFKETRKAKNNVKIFNKIYPFNFVLPEISFSKIVFKGLFIKSFPESYTLLIIYPAEIEHIEDSIISQIFESTSTE